MKSLKRPFTYILLIMASLLIIYSCGKTQGGDPTPAKSSAKDIISFSVNQVTATLSGTTISMVVPPGTPLKELVPAISVSDKATISPGSGVAQDFTKSVNYIVTAEDGSTKTYTVSITAGKSPLKAITAFSFGSLNPVVNAVINDTTKTITATLPAGTVVTSLVPTVAISPNATISPASGTAQDFSKAINYTVKAEDGSTQVYKVTVTVATQVPIVIDCNNVPAIFEDLGPGVDYIITCNIVIPGNTVVTIKPGVTIQFDGPTAGFTVEDASTDGYNDGALNMVGTAANPIVLEGKTATAGSWAGIQVAGNNINNKWAYVTVRDAGASAYTSGLLLDNSNDKNMQISITNCSFLNNIGYGIYDYDNGYSYAQSIFSAFSNNKFSGNTKSALKIKTTELGSLDNTSTYNGNGQNYIEVTAKTELSANITVHNINVPYLIEGIIELNQKMTINAGTTLKFSKDAGFYINYQDHSGTIIANGTSSSPVNFLPFESGTPGYWFGIEIDSIDPQTLFNYCIIDAAGSESSGTGCASKTNTALNFGGRCGDNTYGVGSVTNCTITNSGGYGISYRPGHNVVLTNNTYSGNTLGDVNAYTN